MAPKAIEYQKKVQRTWPSQSSPEGEDVSMALASQSECERIVHTDAKMCQELGKLCKWRA